MSTMSVPEALSTYLDQCSNSLCLQAPTLLVQTIPKENICPFSSFPLYSRNSCAFNALLQPNEANIFSEPKKVVSCSMAQSVSLDVKTFQKKPKSTCICSPGHKLSVILRAKLHTQGHNKVKEPQKPGLVAPCPSSALGKPARCHQKPLL